MGLREAIMPLVPALRRYARAIAGDAASRASLADELVVETLQTALKDERLRRKGEVRLALYALLTSIHRHRARLQASGGAGADAAGVPVFGVSRIERAVAGLPLELREVLALIVVERLTYQEAAEVIAVPPATLLARLTRARDELRIHFNGTVAEERPPRRPPPRVHLRLVK